MKQNYLVIESREVFDGHGEGEDAGTIKFISDGNIWGHVVQGDYYSEIEDVDYDEEEIPGVLEDAKKEYEDLGAEDGYNCFACMYTIREVTDKEAWIIEQVIQMYDGLV